MSLATGRPAASSRPHRPAMSGAVKARGRAIDRGPTDVPGRPLREVPGSPVVARQGALHIDASPGTMRGMIRESALLASLHHPGLRRAVGRTSSEHELYLRLFVTNSGGW